MLTCLSVCVWSWQYAINNLKCHTLFKNTTLYSSRLILSAICHFTPLICLFSDYIHSFALHLLPQFPYFSPFPPFYKSLAHSFTPHFSSLFIFVQFPSSHLAFFSLSVRAHLLNNGNWSVEERVCNTHSNSSACVCLWISQQGLSPRPTESFSLSLVLFWSSLQWGEEVYF